MPIEPQDEIPLKPKPASECNRPLTITNILANNIKPEEDEYIALKDLDTRMHTLKFSQEVAKKYSALNRPDGAPMSLNRYVIRIYIDLTNYKSHIRVY